MRHRSIAPAPLFVPLPFPRLFGPVVGPHGDIRPKGWADLMQAQAMQGGAGAGGDGGALAAAAAAAGLAAGGKLQGEVLTCPVMTKLVATRGFQPCVEQVRGQEGGAGAGVGEGHQRFACRPLMPYTHAFLNVLL